MTNSSSNQDGSSNSCFTAYPRPGLAAEEVLSSAPLRKCQIDVVNDGANMPHARFDISKARKSCTAS